MADGQHIPLAKCRVLYLGSAVPLDTRQGIEAVQNPLRERYPLTASGEVPGIDAWLTAFSSGLLLSYTNDNNTSVWFPISGLVMCASVKCLPQVDQATGQTVATFVALDSEQAKASKHPPLFTCIIRRPMGVKVLECHSFICKTEKAAMALVHACTHAYEHKEGWVEGEPPANLHPVRRQQGGGVDVRLPGLVPAKNSVDSVPPEFYEKPPLQGYYYGNKGLIKNYNVYDNKPNGGAAEVVIGQVTDEVNKKKGGTVKGTVKKAKDDGPKKDAKPAAKKAATPKAAIVKPQPSALPAPPAGPQPPHLVPGMLPPGMLPHPGMMPPPGMFCPPPPPHGFFGPGMVMPPPMQEIDLAPAAPPIPILYPTPVGVTGDGAPGMVNYFSDWDPYNAMPPVVFLPVGDGEPRPAKKCGCQSRRPRRDEMETNDLPDDDCSECRREARARARRGGSRSPDRERGRRRSRSRPVYDDDPRRYRDMHPSFFAEDPDDLVLFGPRYGDRRSPPDPRPIIVERHIEVPVPVPVHVPAPDFYGDPYRRHEERMDIGHSPPRRGYDYGPPPRRGGSPPRYGRGGSPPRRGGSPRGGYGSPPRRGGSPPRRGGSPPRRGGSPRGGYGSPPRRGNSPRRGEYDGYVPPRRSDYGGGRREEEIYRGRGDDNYRGRGDDNYRGREDVYRGREDVYRGREDVYRGREDNYRGRDEIYGREEYARRIENDYPRGEYMRGEYARRDYSPRRNEFERGLGYLP